MHDVSKDEFQGGKLRPEEQVKRTILCNGCEGRKVYLDVRVRVRVRASSATEGGEAGGPGVGWLLLVFVLGLSYSAACKNSTYSRYLGRHVQASHAACLCCEQPHLASKGRRDLGLAQGA